MAGYIFFIEDFITFEVLTTTTNENNQYYNWINDL